MCCEQQRRLGAAVLRTQVAGFRRAKTLDSNLSGVGERENMASQDVKRPCASIVAGHRHSDTREPRDTFPFDKEECHRTGGFVQHKFTRHVAHGE